LEGRGVIRREAKRRLQITLQGTPSRTTKSTSILEAPASPPGVKLFGLERVKRGNELIPVEGYDGVIIPYAADSFDVVILADVLQPSKGKMSARMAGRNKRFFFC